MYKEGGSRAHQDTIFIEMPLLGFITLDRFFDLLLCLIFKIVSLV